MNTPPWDGYLGPRGHAIMAREARGEHLTTVERAWLADYRHLVRTGRHRELGWYPPLSAILRPRTPRVSPTPQPVRHGRTRPHPGSAVAVFGVVAGVIAGTALGIAAYLFLEPFLTWLVS